MPLRIAPGSNPYSGGTGIEIDADKVISILLREEDNLILVNDDNELYTDLQLADGILPSDDFPVGVTVGKILQSDGWTQNGLILNWKTTSGDYARWIYGANGELFFDNGTGVRKQVYYSSEVDDLFTQLRGQLASVAFSGDYNDLINRPAFLQEQADWNQVDSDAPDYIKNKPTIPTVNDGILYIQKNGTTINTFTANQSTSAVANITVPNVIDNVTSTSTNDALSANQGKELQDQINDLKAMGRFLSLWDCITGQPISFPLSTPYNYQTGDYFLVETVSTATPPANLRPNGVQYTGSASTTPETGEVEVGDMYIYDGTIWLLQLNHGKTVSFANLAGQPSDNANLATALNAKADTSSLATVATTGDYGDLLNKPTIPSAQIQSDWNQADNTAVDYIKNKPTIPSAITVDTQLDINSTNPVENRVVTSAINNKADASDANTKTFYLSSTSDTTNAQSAYDRESDGKNALVVYSGDTYLPTSISSTQFVLRSNKIYQDGTNLKNDLMTMTIASDVVTGITVNTSNVVTSGLPLNNTTSYTPSNNYNPATKKYVDDNMTDAVKYIDFEESQSVGATVQMNYFTKSVTPTANITVTAGTLKPRMQYILRVNSGATAYTMSLGTGVTNPFGEDLTLTASKTTTVIFLATSSSTLEVFSVRTES